jgi:hypothetical protein
LRDIPVKIKVQNVPLGIEAKGLGDINTAFLGAWDDGVVF